MTVRLCTCQSDECSRNDRQTVEVSDDCSKSVRLWRWGCIAAAACGLVWVTGTTRHPAPGTSGLSADPDSQRPKLSDIPTRSGEDKKGPKLLLRHRNQTWTNCGQSNLHQLGVMAHIGLEQINSICSTFFGDVFDNRLFFIGIKFSDLFRSRWLFNGLRHQI